MSNGLIYDKVSDIIAYIGKLTIKFNVVLNKKDMNGNANHYYHEYEYNSDKYNNVTTARTIRRDFSAYVSINDRDKKISVIIKAENMLLLRKGLSTACEWFISPDFNELFIIKNKLLILNKEIKTADILIPLAYDNNMIIQPSVITNYDTSVSPGVKITFNNKYSFDINISELFEFQYFMEELNIYQSANTIISSLPRPKLTNKNYTKINSISNTYKPEISEGYVKSANRVKKPESVFDL